MMTEFLQTCPTTKSNATWKLKQLINYHNSWQLIFFKSTNQLINCRSSISKPKGKTISNNIKHSNCQIKQWPKQSLEADLCCKIYLVESLLHQLSAVSTLYQGALGRYRRGPKGEEALRGAVAQQTQKGIGLLWLHRLETSEGCDVAGLRSKPH